MRFLRSLHNSRYHYGSLMGAACLSRKSTHGAGGGQAQVRSASATAISS